MLTVEEAEAVMPYLRTLIHYIRSCNSQGAAKLLLQNLSNDSKYKNEILGGLKELAALIQRHKDPTTRQLREVFVSYSVEFWTHCLLYLLGMPFLRIVPSSVATALINEYKSAKRNSQMRSREMAGFFASVLDQLSVVSFAALGELCSMCDCTARFSRNPKEARVQLSDKLGPLLLLGGANLSNQAGRKKAASSGVLRVLIKESWFLFGLSSEKPKEYAMGIRSGIRSQGSLVIPGSPRSPGRAPAPRNFTESEFNRIKKDLINFYLWRDPDYVRIVDALFEAHEFPAIAQAVLHKYSMLPRGWMLALETFREKGITLSWFESRSIQYADRPMDMYPPTNNIPLYFGTGSERSDVNETVDELIESERTYYETLCGFLNSYVAAIMDLLNGGLKKKEMKKFGLSVNDVEELFGERLTVIRDISRQTLVSMEPISLVRKNTLTKSRAENIADILIEIAPKLHAYAPYLSSHPASARILTKAEKYLKEQQQIAIIAEWSGEPPPAAPNFITLWEEISDHDSNLAGLSIQSVLIKPAQHVPRYKLFLEKLIKRVPSKHPASRKLKEANTMITKAATEINKAVRQHFKVESILGQEMMTPKKAKAKKEGNGGFFSIMNEYPH